MSRYISRSLSYISTFFLSLTLTLLLTCTFNQAQLAPPDNGGAPNNPIGQFTSTGAGSGGIDDGGSYNPLPNTDGSTGSKQPSQFGDNFPDQPPGGGNITYLPMQCQFVSKWPGPRCPATYECVSEPLARQADDGSLHLSYRQSQCVFCAVTEFCTDKQKDQCKQLDVLTDTATVALINQTFGIGDCQKCKEGQFCPANETIGLATSNPFGLAIVNLCAEGSYCPFPAVQYSCPVGFYWNVSQRHFQRGMFVNLLRVDFFSRFFFHCSPPGTKFPFACEQQGTFCPEGSTSPLELCPGGSYCPDPQTIKECPSGYFCKAGSTQPKKCQALASCPAGSAAALLVWQGIIFVILIYALLGGVYYGILLLQARKRKKELIAIAHRAEQAEVVQLLKSLRSFQNLERQAGACMAANGAGEEYEQGYASPNPAAEEAALVAAGTGAGALAAGFESGKSYKNLHHAVDRPPRPRDRDVDALVDKQNANHEFQLAKTAGDDFAIIKKYHSSSNESDKEDMKPEVIGIVSNPNKASGKGVSEDVERAQKHESIAVILPSVRSPDEPVPQKDHLGSDLAAGASAAAVVLPVSKDVKTDADLGSIRSAPPVITTADAVHAACQAHEDDNESECSDEDEDELTGFDAIPCPITLSFDKLGLKLKDGKEILKGVSGEFPHSKLTALMGPSGAGKSTFLNVLCGKATYGKQTGSIRLNGIETTIKSVKSVMGFVPQEDVMHSDLTCYENLYYNAMLRLPRTMSHAQKKQIIEDTIKMLGLEAVQHSVVGSVEKRGISGGQRKRVNIGMEVVSWPTLLFMDEPTSGLDSTAALEVLSALRDLTDLGMSIITVIHQPRFSIVELFHEMLLLGRGGQTVFLGNATQALNYFQDLGFQLPPNENPADFFLDVISGEVRRDSDPDFQPGDLFELWETMGEWVRRGELEPPMEEPQIHEDSDNESNEPGSHAQVDKSPSKNFLSPPASLMERSVSEPRPRIGPPALNTATPSAKYQHQFHRYNNAQRGSGTYTPFTPYDMMTARYPPAYRAGPPPLQRSNTTGNHITSSNGGTDFVLPASQGIIDARSQTVGTEPVGPAGGRSVMRSPQRGHPYFYPYPATNAHKRSRSSYHAMNAYRAGVTSAADLPLPKHRELLNKLGKDGIGKLVEEYEEYRLHPGSPKLFGGVRSPKHNHGTRHPWSGKSSKGTPASRDPFSQSNQKDTPASSANNTNNALTSPPDRFRSTSAAAPSNAVVRHPGMLRSSSLRRLNMLFDRHTNARNIVSTSARGGGSTPFSARPLQRQNTAHQLTNRPPSPRLQRKDIPIQVGSPEFSPDIDEFEPEANERTPLTPGDHIGVHEDGSDAWKVRGAHPSALPSKSPDRPSSRLSSRSQYLHPSHARQGSSLDEIAEESDEPLSGRIVPSESPKREPSASSKHDRSPSSTPTPKVKFHDHDEVQNMPQMEEVELNEPPEQKRLSDRSGNIILHPPLSIPSATQDVIQPRHARAGSGFQPALATIPSEGDLGSTGSSPESTESARLAKALKNAASEQSHSKLNGSNPPAAVKVDGPKHNLKNHPTISVLSPALKPRAASPSTALSTANKKTDAVSMPMAHQMGVLPPKRDLPYIHTQFLYLIQRQSLKLLRNINEVVFDMSLTTAVGLAIGLIFGGVWTLNGYATISVMAVLSIGVLSAVSALKMFGNDRVVFWRESSAGISVTAYWLAVTLMHLPLTLIFSFLFVAPYYNLILPDAELLDVWWVFIAIHFACSGGGMLLSVVFSPIPALLSGVMIPLIIGGFLNGVSPPLSEMGSVMRFLCDISYSRYGVEALMVQQLGIQPDYADTIVNDIFDKFGFVDTHFKFALGMLFVIGCILRLCTLLALHGLHRDKRV